MLDAVIAGGGPVGLYLGKLLEEEGLEIRVLEEHRKIGSPLQCSGLYSENIMKLVDLPEGLIKNRVSKAIIHTPKTSLVVGKKHIAAFVVDRVGMDMWLAKQVSGLSLGTRLVDFKVTDGGIKSKTNRGLFGSRMLIGCDGPNSVVAGKMGVSPGELVTGIMAIKAGNCNDDFVELFYDKKKIADGFFWKIPRGDSVEYGALGKHVNFRILEDFFRIRDYKKAGGLIPIGPVSRSYSERILLAGDAAGHVKPWSGGGVVYGLSAARAAAKTIKDAVEKNDFSRKSLSSYERQWKKALGTGISLGLLGRKMMKKMNNFEMEVLFSALRIVPLGRLDMDFIFSRKAYSY